jgi:hypothetical protein
MAEGATGRSEAMTLSQLKRAIEKVQPYRQGSLAAALSTSAGWAVADAWRAAFDWHAALGNRHGGNLAKGLDELEEGMRLIREKLR